MHSHCQYRGEEFFFERVSKSADKHGKQPDRNWKAWRGSPTVRAGFLEPSHQVLELKVFERCGVEPADSTDALETGEVGD